MAELLANLAVGCIVALAVCYAAYALGPAKLRTWLLTQIGRIFGVRVLGFVLRHSKAGCGDCAQAGARTGRRTIKPAR